MKFAEITLLSLLLFRFCSSRTLVTRKPSDIDYSRPTQNQHSEDQKSQTLAQLQNTIYQKLHNTYLELSSSGNYSVRLDDLPNLADPVYVGSAVDHYSLVQVRYRNVQFQGLRGAHHAVLNVNTYSQVATLTLNLDTAEVDGHYEGFDLARNTSGNFRIKMDGSITYVCTYRYRVLGDRNVQMLRSSGHLRSQNTVSHYDIVVSYSPSIQKALQTALLQKVDERVNQVLLAKLSDRIQKYIMQIYPNHRPDSIERGMREGINSTVKAILQALAKHGVVSIDLTSDNKEIVYNKLRAKIVSARLNGIEKLYLASNQVSRENPDKIHVKVQLAISRLTATAIVTIHEAHEEDAPFRSINVDFDMDQLVVELSLDKPVRQSGLELRSVRTSLNRIRPLGAEKFESQVSNFVKEKLTNHMKPYVEKGLENFVQNQYVAMTSQGVLPPIQ